MAKKTRNRLGQAPYTGPRCHRCDQPIDPATAVWLVLSCSTGRFYATDAEADATGCNQGGFVFGAACARRALAEKGN